MAYGAASSHHTAGCETDARMQMQLVPRCSVFMTRRQLHPSAGQCKHCMDPSTRACCPTGKIVASTSPPCTGFGPPASPGAAFINRRMRRLSTILSRVARRAGPTVGPKQRTADGLPRRVAPCAAPTASFAAAGAETGAPRASVAQTDSVDRPCQASAARVAPAAT